MLAIPNFSEGRDSNRIAALADALRGPSGVTLLDTHSDPDHNRTVFTLYAPGARAPALIDAVVAGADVAVRLLDIRTHVGIHPRIGVLDVAPIVYLDERQRGLACALALVLAERLAVDLQIPVFLYGVLSGIRVSRAQVRRGGPAVLAGRLSAGELVPDFGPRQLHPSAGATLVAARPPLVAFNLELEPPATLADARRIAALIREGGAEGLPAVRALGLKLPHRANVAQVSTNIEDHTRTSATDVVAAITKHARIARAELVGLAPRAAFAEFPDGLPVANRHYLEDRLAELGVKSDSHDPPGTAGAHPG